MDNFQNGEAEKTIPETHLSSGMDHAQIIWRQSYMGRSDTGRRQQLQARELWEGAFTGAELDRH